MDRSRGSEDPVASESRRDAATFETTRDELRTTFEYQVQRLREIDSKAIEILKANLLLIGLVVTVLPLFMPARPAAARLVDPPHSTAYLVRSRSQKSGESCA